MSFEKIDSDSNRETNAKIVFKQILDSVSVAISDVDQALDYETDTLPNFQPAVDMFEKYKGLFDRQRQFDLAGIIFNSSVHMESLGFKHLKKGNALAYVPDYARAAAVYLRLCGDLEKPRFCGEVLLECFLEVRDPVGAAAALESVKDYLGPDVLSSWEGRISEALKNKQ